MTTPDEALRPDPVPFETEHVNGETRHRFNVCVVCIPIAERDVSRQVMPDDDAVAARGFKEGLGGDTPDDHPYFTASTPASLERARAARDAGEPEPWRHLDGGHVWYTLMLTADEADQHRAASNCRAVTVDSTHWPI